MASRSRPTRRPPASTSPSNPSIWRSSILACPGEDGLSLTRSLREQGEIGLLILTGRQDATDRIVGLEIGADDYVLKPVELRELLARVRSILRRSGRGNGGVRRAHCQQASALRATGPPTLASRALLRATASGSS